MRYFGALAKTFVGSLGFTALSVLCCLPAHAEPADGSCPLAMPLICRFVPIEPDLEGDVDLTTQLPPAGPGVPAPDLLPPTAACARGCA